MKSLDNERRNNLYKELKQLKGKISELTTTNFMLIEEQKDLEKRLNYFTNNKKTNQSYEDLLQEQFDNMRDSFKEELTRISKEHKDESEMNKKLINNLKEEIVEINSIKDIFVRRLNELTSILY
jgi:hypothetical protein